MTTGVLEIGGKIYKLIPANLEVDTPCRQCDLFNGEEDVCRAEVVDNFECFEETGQDHTMYCWKLQSN